MSRSARLGLLVALVAGAIGGCSLDERTLNAVPGSVGGQGGAGPAGAGGEPTTEGGGADSPTTQGGGDAGSSAGTSSGEGGVAGDGGTAGGDLAGKGGQGGAGKGGAAGAGGQAGISGGSGQGGASGAGASGASGQSGAGQAGSGGDTCDQACIDSCKEKYPGGSDELDSLYGCIVINCSGPCNTSSEACQTCQSSKCSAKFQACEANGACESILQCINGASECGICQQQSCKTELSNCSDGSECIALYDCLIDQKCGSNTTCQQQCVGQHPQGLTPLNALSDCIDAKCDTQCPPGQ